MNTEDIFTELTHDLQQLKVDVFKDKDVTSIDILNYLKDRYGEDATMKLYYIPMEDLHLISVNKDNMIVVLKIDLAERDIELIKGARCSQIEGV